MARLYSWQKTAAYYRELGYEVHKTEYTSRGTRHDLAGFIDGIAWGVGETLYLQACGGSDFQEHYRKITGQCRNSALRCLMAGADNRIILIGWRKLKRKGRMVWVPRIQEITVEDLMR